MQLSCRLHIHTARTYSTSCTYSHTACHQTITQHQRAGLLQRPGWQHTWTCHQQTGPWVLTHLARRGTSWCPASAEQAGELWACSPCRHSLGQRCTCYRRWWCCTAPHPYTNSRLVSNMHAQQLGRAWVMLYVTGLGLCDEKDITIRWARHCVYKTC